MCSTVIPSLTDLLTFFRKLQKKTGALPSQYSAILPPVLDAIVSKMKYDETASWGDEDDQTDEAEFQELRKRLHVLQQTVAAIDESFYIETLSRVVGDIFTRLSAQDQTLNWRDLDLALHEMYLFGELAVRNQGLYAKREPSSVAAQRLVGMMSSMVESGMCPIFGRYFHKLIPSRPCELSAPLHPTAVYGNMCPLPSVLRTELSSDTKGFGEFRAPNTPYPREGAIKILVPIPALRKASASSTRQCIA